MNAAVETGDDPFEDGNGRIGCSIAEKALAQSLRYPTRTTLAATILAKRKAYLRRAEGEQQGQRYHAVARLVRSNGHRSGVERQL
jgi:Fic family protein